MRKRAFSMTEVILGVSIIVLAMGVFLTVFSSSARQSVQSRNRTVAIMLANTLLDEIAAHPYGSPPPQSWSQPVHRPVRAWVEGKEQAMEFHAEVKPKNGSFIGTVAGETDEVTITVSWREGVGTPQPGVLKPEDNKVLSVSIPVWKGKDKP